MFRITHGLISFTINLIELAERVEKKDVVYLERVIDLDKGEASVKNAVSTSTMLKHGIEDPKYLDGLEQDRQKYRKGSFSTSAMSIW